ncbi:hypothetical protein [Pseudomonas gozinkensis]|uniref:hypothetical protein n=1 Tax=Pseudomonas gozinkensis TaxID=2774461 RepID=UPI0017882D7F|nr:hypothetical protein [Pseudomonas gozinkensis]
MNIKRKSTLLPALFIVISGMSYAGLSMASYAKATPTVGGQKAIYAEDCTEKDKINGQCTKK